MIGEAIYNLLNNHAGLTALVGANKFPVIIKQETKAPYVVFKLNTVPNYTKDGPCDRTTTVYIMVIASKYLDTGLIAEHVLNALELKAGTYNNTQITDSFCTNIDDDFTDYDELFIKAMEFTFSHNNA